MLICGKFVKLCSLCLMDNLVEHEFTVNKQFSIKNLKEKSLIELRWVQTICQHQKNPPKKFKSLEICCITSKRPVRNTKKTFANNGRRKKMKESH